MKRGFTLLELLVVIGIMGLLGTVSIGGYRAITRGMEERGAIDNASQFIHAAFQRALIDRQPVAIYFWNETIKGETADDNAIVVGKAVAVRYAGRLSRVNSDMLYDEFADLNLSYDVKDSASSGNRDLGMYLYPINTGTSFERSRVSASVYEDWNPEVFASSASGTSGMVAPPGNGEILMYGFKRLGGYSDWHAGDAYGFEFQNLTLPHNYIFGKNFETSMQNPISQSSQKKMLFGFGKGGYENRQSNVESGNGTIDVCALRPNPSGVLAAVKVGTTKNPAEEAK